MTSPSRVLLVALVLGALGLPMTAAARIWVVNPDGSGEAATIQAAIDLATGGDTIELADGTYVGDGNRDLDPGGKAIEIVSASGRPALCVIDCQGSTTEPHRAFTFQSGEGPDTAIRGLSIINGYTTSQGGAIFCNEASPTITNCCFRDNETQSHGGAIYALGSEVRLIDCVFEGGLADGGGGMTVANTSQPTLTRCLFRNNRADIGGGFESRSYATPELVDCTFSENIANGAGGAIFCDNAGFTMTGCTLWANDGGLFGAGGISGADPATTSVSHSLIAGSVQGLAVDVVIDLSCCNLFGNAGGNWVGPLANQLGVDGNIEEDPQFCSSSPGDDGFWGVQSDSPCAPEHSACGLIGAWDVACGATPARSRSWSEVKGWFR